MGGHISTEGDFTATITRRLRLENRAKEIVLYSRKSSKIKKRHIFSGGDLREVFLLLIYTLYILIFPRDRWAGFARRMAGMRYRRHRRKRYAGFADSFEAVFGKSTSEDKESRFRSVREAMHRRRIIAIAEITGIKWAPAIELHNRAALDAALARGKGVVIWCGSFMAQGLPGKRALHEAGLKCHQVSVHEHGFTLTRFGQRVLNPVMVKAENRYLESRIVFDRSDTYKVAKRISSVLRQNGIVLMTNNTYSGSSFAELDIGLSGKVELATSPVNFAVRGGAALFAMSTFEVEPFRAYKAVLSPEILLEKGDRNSGAGGRDGKSDVAIASALSKVRDRLLEAIEQAPDQFLLWGGQIRAASRFGESRSNRSAASEEPVSLGKEGELA